MRILALLLMLLPFTAQAQLITEMPCQPIAFGEATLAMNGFALQSGGVDSDGGRIELWTDGTNRFLVMLRRPKTDSLCLVLGGDGWESLAAEKGV